MNRTTIAARPRARIAPGWRHFCLVAAGAAAWLGAAVATAQAAPAGAASASSSGELLSAQDFYRAVDVEDPQVSPHGRWVAYVATRNDRASDAPHPVVWVASWDGQAQRAMTSPSADAAQPRWSPDGRYLAVLGKPRGTDRAQILLLDRQGGEAVALTAVDGDIGAYAWSPDGRQIVFVMEPSDPLAAGKPAVIEALHFKEDGEGYLSVGRNQHLYLVDVASHRVEPLTSGELTNDRDPAWSPDGRRIAFVRTREHGADQDGKESIEIIDARDGAQPHEVLRPYAPNGQKLVFSPDGTEIAFLQGLAPRYNAYMQDHLYLVAASGGTPRRLAPRLDRAVMSYAFMPDGRHVDITVEDDRSEYPAEIDLGSGAVRRLVAAGPYVVGALNSAAGHTAVIYSDDHALGEVYAIDQGRLRKLSAQNAWLAGRRLGAVRDVQFADRDGVRIHGLLVEPPGYDSRRKYPLLLWIHGGPNGQDEHSLALDGYQFEPQMFAARGFLVLRVNYRGSSGRGIAFAEAILADWGDKEVQDLLAGVDYVVNRGLADPNRLAIGGWSYGGILTDYTIAHDNRFKVAISGAGSADQFATYGSDQYVLQYNHELGPPWVDPSLWTKVSYPFFHANRIHTPTLFMGGTKDFNVPIVGGEQMYESLRTLGVPARLIVYPDQHHIFTRPSFLVDMAGRMMEWVDQHLPR